MTLTQVQALVEYWKEWPPVHEATKLAWFKLEEKSESGGKGEDLPVTSEATIAAFKAIEGVSPHWRGGPPIRPADVMKLAEEAKQRKQNG